MKVLKFLSFSIIYYFTSLVCFAQTSLSVPPSSLNLNLRDLLVLNPSNSWEVNEKDLIFYTYEEINLQKSINNSLLNEYVLTYSIENVETEKEINITPWTWKWYDFRMVQGNDTTLSGSLRRPNIWALEENIIEIGSKFYLNLSEFNINGIVEVTDIKPSLIDTRISMLPLLNKNQRYRPITGWFKRTTNDVYDYYFSSGDTISSTPSHRFYSINDKDYKPISDFKKGELVQLQNNTAVHLLGNTKRENGLEEVYNLEIFQNHNYFVGKNKILVHNAYGDDIKGYVQDFTDNFSNTAKIESISSWWSKGWPGWFERGTFFENLLAKSYYIPKGWINTPHHYHFIDFYKIVSGKTTIISMKTSIQDLNSWKSSNLSHLNNINNAKAGPIGDLKIHAKEVELHIYVPKDKYDDIMATLDAWKVSLKDTHPHIDKVFIRTIENAIGL